MHLTQAFDEVKKLIILNGRTVAAAVELEREFMKNGDPTLSAALIIAHLRTANREMVDLMTKIATQMKG